MGAFHQKLDSRAGKMKACDFHPKHFPAGAKHRLEMEAVEGASPVCLPVLLARGRRQGKTLVVMAGVHGDEYEGVSAVFQIFHEVDPEQMTGDLLAIPVANPPAFWAGSRTSPLDGRNLAREFPGTRDAGPTAEIAYHLDRSVIAAADFYLDLHSGGIRYLMPTMVGYDATDDRSRAAALCFGANVMWGHSAIGSGRTISAAKARAIPFLYTEARGSGRVAEEDAGMFRRGIRNTLQHLGILSGKPEPVAIEHHLLGDGDIDQGITCVRRGFLTAAVGLLDNVREGQLLGTVADLLGNCIDTLYAPRSGQVALIHAFPVIEPGEPAFFITGTHS